MAANLELDLLGLAVTLDAGSYIGIYVSAGGKLRVISQAAPSHIEPRQVRGGTKLEPKRTRGVLAAADLNELLDIGDFGRHNGGLMQMMMRWRGSND